MRELTIILFLFLTQPMMILLGFVNVATSSGSIKWVRIHVPQYRVPGEMAQLECDYDLGNDSLYAVKWYKDHEEFYRYVPRAKPEFTSYPVEGVYVDISLSTRNRVVLRSVNLKTSGMFRCEVSAEAPSFSSAQSEALMEVVSLPEEDPIITGMELNYPLGEEIDLNCTSGKSHPASEIHWYVNDIEVASPDNLIQYPPFVHAHGLVSTIVGLRFVLHGSHFVAGAMRVKCVASVSPVLWKGDMESVVHSLPLKGIREALVLVKGSAQIQRQSMLFILTTYSVLKFLS
ncbi:uncharacterized protein [Onthophagus taurus]|uniref:uncharacterized protein n=1 Tax=Onthophagus taurus TaxID=166361 RepID=UPI000C207303|nr:uncharacterized protein LOC111413411 [Onthophagus taurus]